MEVSTLRFGFVVTALTMAVSLLLITSMFYMNSNYVYIANLRLENIFLQPHVHKPPNPAKDISFFDGYNAYMTGHLVKHTFSDQDLLQRFTVQSNGSDVIILLRIQKTGSTSMGFRFQHDLDLSHSNWTDRVLFKKTIFDWPCGLHADWTHLHECAEESLNRRFNMKIKRRYLYVTMVRDPLRRYVSEWLQVRRGATWKRAPYKCNGRSATSEELSPCYTSPDWKNVSLLEFMNCSSNMAVNRQTRMLANLSDVNCYNTSGMSLEERYERMLTSAKDNLRNMAYFGLTGYQVLSQILFENTFNLRFNVNFVDSNTNQTYAGRVVITEGDRKAILHLNRYDVMLYHFAKDLFMQRLQKVAETSSVTLSATTRKKIREILPEYETYELLILYRCLLTIK